LTCMFLTLNFLFFFFSTARLKVDSFVVLILIICPLFSGSSSILVMLSLAPSVLLDSF